VNFKKAIIYLDGVSSAIIDLAPIRKNIYDCLRCLNIPFEEYQNTQEGFKKLQEDFNDEKCLYIVCDSLVYHLCDKSAVIIISRSTAWMQSTPKKNCIGRLTQEQIAQDWSELAGIIHRKTPMRQFHNHKAANTFLVYSEYNPKCTNELYRNSMAMSSWCALIANDYHVELIGITDDKLPFVGNMLKTGMEISSHPDDLIVILNRDICLVPESIGIVRAFMDSRNINHCYSHRVDVEYTSHLNFKQIKGMPFNWGIDFFVFRPSSEVINQLIATQLYIGRTDWDNYWASLVKNRLPYNICYHFPHNGEWRNNLDSKNTDNQKEIWDAMPEVMMYDEIGFRGLGPLS